MMMNTPINEAQVTPWQTKADPEDGSHINREPDASNFLKSEYGIPPEGGFWLLRRAPYRPEPASYRDTYPYGPESPVKEVDGWTRAGVIEAARQFMAECTKETAKLWSHRKVAGQFPSVWGRGVCTKPKKYRN